MAFCWLRALVSYTSPLQLMFFFICSKPTEWITLVVFLLLAHTSGAQDSTSLIFSLLRKTVDANLWSGAPIGRKFQSKPGSLNYGTVANALGPGFFLILTHLPTLPLRYYVVPIIRFRITSSTLVRALLPTLYCIRT